MVNKQNKSTNSIKWIATKRRYVCFIDIMGFQDMIATKKHSEIYKMMKKVVEFQRFSSDINWLGKPNLVKTSTYSDSIMIYSLNDSFDSLESITCTISSLIYDLLSEGIPFKGALALGTMTCDTTNSIFFGQPLIDSYLLQKELYFYGIIVHGSAQKGIEHHNLGLFINTYNCPLKKGKSNHLTISPIYLGTAGRKKENTKLLKSVNNMKFYTSGHLRIYIDSTIEYLETIKAEIKAKSKQ